MSDLTRQLTIAELSDRILDMAKTGVYRESVFEAFRPVATKREISHAIRHAKQFGLKSVAQLRDAELGTYYQVDVQKCAALERSRQLALPLSEADVMQRLTDTLTTLKLVLTVAGSSAIALGSLGVLMLLTGKAGLGWSLEVGAMSVGAIWAMQQAIARKVQ